MTKITDLKGLTDQLAGDLESCVHRLRANVATRDVSRQLAEAIVVAIVAMELHPEIVVRDPIVPN